MMAEIEKPDHSYEWREMGEPVCGEDFCDNCGDCLHCDGIDDGYCDPCRWVIYLQSEKNPYHV